MMRCTQNKFEYFSLAYPYWVGSGRVGSEKSWVGSVWVTKSDPCPTLIVDGRWLNLFRNLVDGNWFK